MKISEGNKGKIISADQIKILIERNKGNKYGRHKDRWPHEKGSRCQCDECKSKWREYYKNHNKNYLKTYMRKLKCA